MTPDDPRHGTWAGSQAHRKEGSNQCPPCREAASAHLREWRQLNPGPEKRLRGEQKIRNRALRELGQRHPEELASIIATIGCGGRAAL